MEYYKILGVDENASMDEVKKAYDDKVNKFKEEIKDEKRVKMFIKEFDKAYEEIKKERAKNENTQSKVRDSKESDFRQHSSTNLNESTYDDFDDEYAPRKRSRKKSSTNSSSSRRSNTAKKQSKDDKNDNKDNEKKQVRQRKKSSKKGSIVLLPLKILALPIILILSIIIFLCEIIKVVSWIASKVVIIAAISASAIHGYQIYIGHAVIYEVFIISGIGFIVALFLPSIVKIVPSILGGVNNSLKNFVF